MNASPAGERRGAAAAGGGLRRRAVELCETAANQNRLFNRFFGSFKSDFRVVSEAGKKTMMGRKNNCSRVMSHSDGVIESAQAACCACVGFF